ncbi:acyloxyacyl hydrolase [Ruegeria sp. 2012CJ41-6]|uniref:Acyloxyacyl hydrolase n=2 Tax=Ruegeria spongiae TaxID=2942209 RepID=A0ABT0Q1S7_9RHOB|nr:acyloxyacyl hydrolase [Ruegeria spongiae]
MIRILLAALLLTAGANVAQAQSLIVGAGYADFSNNRGKDQALFALDYHHSPFHEAMRFSAGWGGTLSIDTSGDTHIGAGLYGVYRLGQGWFLEGSVMPGAYFESESRNDLGGNFQIRSLFGVGYAFDNGNKLSLSVSHKSNASTEDFNPGVNEAMIRYHFSF